MNSTVKLAIVVIMLAAVTFWSAQHAPQTSRAAAETLEADGGASTPLPVARAADVQDAAEDGDREGESPTDGDYASPRAHAPTLSHNAFGVVADGQRYWCDDGQWYVERSSGLSGAHPPIGVIVPTLPLSATTTWVGSVPYACAFGVCYVPAPRGYAVASPPPSLPS